MTSKKGSLWKTSWNRGRGTPIPEPVGKMAFFQNFKDGVDSTFYKTTPDSTLGLALPFWFGIVGIRTGDQKVTGPDTLDNLRPFSDTDIINATGTVNGVASVLYDVSLPVAGDDYVCAALVRVTEDADGTTFTVRVRLCDQVEARFQGDSITVPPSFPLVLNPNELPGALHGFCGGPGLLTDAEVRTWFRQLRSMLAIQKIPGKTTHLYSAAAVYPLVPATLTNLGSDATQDMALSTTGTPAPVNVEIPVRFAY
jgi:hypothetical protein